MYRLEVIVMAFWIGVLSAGVIWLAAQIPLIPPWMEGYYEFDKECVTAYNESRFDDWWYENCVPSVGPSYNGVINHAD
jgi:hypothetical protein